MDFTVPGTTDQYAPEVYYFTREGFQSSPSPAPLRAALEVQPAIEQLPTDAVLELDLLQPGGDPTESGDWLLAQAEWSAVGLGSPQALASWPGIRFRMKSGGTSGTGKAHFSAVD